jgi:phosphoribosyl 1,2-cyclic phosphodiesterase
MNHRLPGSPGRRFVLCLESPDKLDPKKGRCRVSTMLREPMEKRRSTVFLDAPAVTFWGVRGSIPVPGPATAMYGGNTTCLEVEPFGAADGQRVIIDAGSGLVALGHGRDWSGVRRIDILLTHLHHDHVIGLPFFKPMFLKGVEIHLWCGNLGGETAEAALSAMFAPPLFPLRLDQLPAHLVFHGFHAGETIDVAGVAVRTVLLNHPSGATGYRFDGADGSLAIITDAAPCPDVTALCRDVDTLIYDSMLDEADYGRCRGWGHSTASAAVELARVAGARRLVGCHHAPEHTDAVMSVREARLKAVWPSGLMAREGMRLSCAPED